MLDLEQETATVSGEDNSEASFGRLARRLPDSDAMWRRRSMPERKRTRMKVLKQREPVYSATVFGI